MAQPLSGNLKRDVGLVGLTFVSVSGMLGAGWLFAPLLVSQQAGPGAVLSWIIGGLMILLITLTFAEISSLLPIAGGIARLPHFSYGNVTSMAMGFTAWVGYMTNAPITTLVLLEYVGHNVEWIYHGDVKAHDLSPAGVVFAGVILFLMVLINIISVRALSTANTIITWFKLVIPLAVSGAIIASHFDVSNFTSHGGFAPYGVEGILAGVATGGVMFAYTGFRHAIDLAGETRNPRVTIPLALTLSVIICTAIYAIVQIAFIGAVPKSDIANGWDHLAFAGDLGPLANIAAAIGLMWVGAVIYGGAIIAPFGGGLVSTGSNARLTLGLSRNGYLFPFFNFLSRRGVPVRALLLNYVLSMVMVVVVPFEEMVTLNIATLVLSFTVGPLSVYAFRRQIPDRPRGFRLPMVSVTAPAAFVCSVLILYWSGWDTLGRLLLIMALGLLLYGLRVALDRSLLKGLDWRQAVWLIPFMALLLLVSYLGNFGGGLGVIPFGWDMLACTAAALVAFALAAKSRLPKEKVERYLAEEFAEDVGDKEL